METKQGEILPSFTDYSPRLKAGGSGWSVSSPAMAGLTDTKPGLRRRPALTPYRVGLRFPLPHRWLDQPRCRPQALVLTRPGDSCLTRIESVIFHVHCQPGREEIALDGSHSTGTLMPALRERLFLSHPTQACLAQTGGHGRELVDLRASVPSFAPKMLDECTRCAKPD
jgi:hypothetical protein